MNEVKQCQFCRKDFTIEAEDFKFYEKIKVPPPTWCPRCRFIRKLAFINERSLYKGTCAQCDSKIISMYASPLFPVWCVKCFISDSWEALDYGIEYNFSKTFFEQFIELKNSIPHRALEQNERNGSGCEYSNLCYTSKNVYLSFNTIGSENIKYCKYVLKQNKDCFDCLIIRKNDRVYELVQASENFNSTFLVESDQCVESHFLYDCTNCINCCLSSNIRNKSFVLRNKQLTKEEYNKELDALNLGTYSGQQKTKKEFLEMKKEVIHRFAHIKNSVNAVGDFIENSKNVSYCYGLVNGENLKWVYFAVNTAKDSHDMIFVGKAEECYEATHGGRGASRLILSFNCGAGSKDLFYCYDCKACSDCFGCVGLKKKQHCILNKQYTKEEYEKFTEKIKKHMNDMPYVDKVGRKYKFGDGLPVELSPFAYNETVAFEESPLTKDETLSLGYKWKDTEEKNYVPTIKSKDLPEDINEVSLGICKEVIECPNKGNVATQCTSAFKILEEELIFYKQMNLPLPRYCPNCRYHNRLIFKNRFLFYERECMCDKESHDHEEKCKVKFETMYPPDRSEIIYCKDCYQKELY